MKILLLLLFLVPVLGKANTVKSVSDEALVELQSISNSWKKVKNPKTATNAVILTKSKSAKLLQLAKTLSGLKRPNNKERQALKKERQKTIDKIGLEMANTMMLLRRQPRSMAILSSGLIQVEEEMAVSQKVFDYYFEPDVEAKSKTTLPK